MRKINVSDVFVAARAVDKLGIKEKLKNFKIDSSKSVEENGVSLMFDLFSTCTDEKSEKILYEVLSGPLERAPEEVKKMDLINLVKELSEAASLEEWRTFLQSAARLIK